MRRINGLLLGALVLLATTVSYSATAPAYDASTKFDTAIENTVFEFYVNLYKYLFDALDKTSDLLESVLKDDTIMPNNNINQTKELLQNYIAETKERRKPPPKNVTNLDGFLCIVANIHTINLFGDIVKRYNTTSLPTPSDEVRLIEAALKRHGLDELINHLKIRKTEFINEFLRKMDIAVTNLSEVDKIKCHKLVEWYQNYRNSTEEQRANDVFTHFAHLLARF
ncbi:PREDICTED: uncharacterized protein LOC108967915 [Bactrocera latifrons]|uniref:Uncharacterized protein n=2 Tax=Bactrocera latifrons TaxID=174628 RepID=A0A0K8VBG1_BACLA|nr:PREDICTED: uncharacterized protein LOC108967915 [Bactrocera latifrons]XP_018787148.1 PREDICTED: uncharacterized protein LOC108967915 [Bactrocera latifrons]